MAYLRTLAILVLTAVVFVGCDNNDDDNGNVIDRVTITEVTVLEFPCDDNGDPWDDGSDPDIYYVLFDDNSGDELDSTEGDDFPDVACGEVLTWDGNYSSRDFDRPLAIELFNSNLINDEFMGSTRVFDLDEAFDRPSLTVTGPNNVEVRLTLDWE